MAGSGCIGTLPHIVYFSFALHICKWLFEFIFAYMYLSFLKKMLTLIFLEELANI